MKKLGIALLISSLALATAVRTAAAAKKVPPPYPAWWNIIGKVQREIGGGGIMIDTRNDPATDAAFKTLGLDLGWAQMTIDEAGSIAYIDGEHLQVTCNSFYPIDWGLMGDAGGGARDPSYRTSMGHSVSRTPSGGFRYLAQAEVVGGPISGPVYSWAGRTPGTRSINQTFPAAAEEVVLTGRAFDFPDAQIDGVGTISYSIAMTSEMTSEQVSNGSDESSDVSYAFKVHIPQTGEDRFATLLVMKNDPSTGHEASVHCNATAGGVTPNWTVTASGDYRIALRGAFEVSGAGNSMSAAPRTDWFFEDHPVTGGDAGGCSDPSCIP
jgi:hypothetical protein